MTSQPYAFIAGLHPRRRGRRVARQKRTPAEARAASEALGARRDTDRDHT